MTCAEWIIEDSRSVLGWVTICGLFLAGILVVYGALRVLVFPGTRPLRFRDLSSIDFGEVAFFFASTLFVLAGGSLVSYVMGCNIYFNLR